MTPPGSRRNFFLGGSGLPFEYPENTRALARIQLSAELPISNRNSALFRQDEALRRLLTLGYPHLGPVAASAPPTAADMEAAVRSLWESGRQGNRLGYIDAMRGAYVLLHHQMGRPEARPEIPRIARLFSDISEEYARLISDRSEFSPMQRLTYLFASARVTRLFLGRLSDHDAGSVPEYAGEIGALQGSLRRFHESLGRYVQAAQSAESGNAALEGIRLQIEMRRAILEGESDRARVRAQELAAFYRAHPPLEEDPANPESQRFYHSAGRELLSDPEFLHLTEALNAPSTAEQQGGVLNGVSLQWLATAAAALDQINEDSEATIRARYQALSAVTTALSLAKPGASLRELLQMLRGGSAADHLAELRQVESHSPEIAAYLREAGGGASLEDLWQRAAAASTHVESLRQGAGRRALEALLSGNEAQHPVRRLVSELGRHPGLRVALGLESEVSSPAVGIRNALELLRRGEEGIRQVREFGERHPDLSLRSLMALLAPASGAAAPIDVYAEELLESLQEGLGSREDHEEAMAQALFQCVAGSGEITPQQNLSSSVLRHARSLVSRMEGAGYRSYRVLRHLVAPQSLAALGIGIIATELTPALLIARAGATGRLAAPLIGDLVRAGTLSRRGAVLSGLGTGLGMSFVGTSLHSLHQQGLGLRTHYGRDLLTSSLINSATFGSTMLFAHGWGRLLAPNAANGFAIGEMGLARGLALHGGNALFGTGVGMGLGIVARRVQTGAWATSWDEVAENFATMLAWEAGAAGLRGLRRSAGLNGELGLPEGNRLARWWNRLPLLRQPTVIGEHRATRVAQIADRMIQANPSLSSERPFLLRQLGLHEAQAPGSLDSFTDAMFRDYEPRLSGTAESRRLLMVRRAVASAETSGVPAAPPREAPNSTRRDRHGVVLDLENPVVATVPLVVEQAREVAAHEAAPHVEVDEAALTPPRGMPAVDLQNLAPQPLAQGVLETGVPIMVVEVNGAASRRGEHFLAAPGTGEVAAFTHEGISKHHPPRNEDAYGLMRLDDGSVVALAFDGAGGSGAGDLASALGIQAVMTRYMAGENSLGNAFLEAHHSIERNGRGGYTVATGIRVHPDGQVEVATVGDTQLYVARPRGDGTYNVFRPFFPHNIPGMLRASGRDAVNTLEMNAHPSASTVLSALGSRGMVVTNQLVATPGGNFHPQGIYNAALTLPAHPDGTGAHQPFRAESGDIFLMMSDGVHELFTREQMADVMRGLRGAGEIRDAIQRETEARLEILRLSRQNAHSDARVPIPYGRFQGSFVDRQGDVYSTATGGNRIGHVAADNVVLVALRYDPEVRVPESSVGPSAAEPSGVETSASDPVFHLAPATETNGEVRGEVAEPHHGATLAHVETQVSGASPNAEIVARLHAGIRTQLLAASQARVHRDSPTAPVILNRVHADIAIDPATGEVVPLDRADPRRHLIQARVQGEADHNLIFMDLGALQSLQYGLASSGLSAEMQAQASGILNALGELHQQPIFPRESLGHSVGFNPMPSVSGEPVILPSVPLEFIQGMRRSLLHLLETTSRYPKTMIFTEILQQAMDTGTPIERVGVDHVLVGQLFLGPNGEVIAANLGLPDIISPRGTRYRTGVATGGEAVEVVLGREGAILFAEPQAGLNDRQEAALSALIGSPENREAVQRFQETFPQVLDQILAHSGTASDRSSVEVAPAEVARDTFGEGARVELLPAYPENRPPLFTFRMESLRERDPERGWGFGTLLIDSGEPTLISRLSTLREAILEPHVGSAPWTYQLTSPSRDLIIHRNYDSAPLVLRRGGTERVVIRPGDSVTVSEFLPEQNRIGDISLAFIHHRPGVDE